MVDAKNFDMDVWKANCKKFKNNREGLGFETKFSVEDGHMIISFENVDEKYVPALKQLAFACAHGAIACMSRMIAPTYALDKDVKEEAEICSKAIQENAEELMKILFNSDAETFILHLLTLNSILSTRYELKNVKLSDGKFVYNSRFGEHYWDGRVFVHEKNDSVLMTPWSQLLPIFDKISIENQKENIA